MGSLSKAPTLPTFDQLPLNPSHPKGTAWGIWDNNRGTMNHLTSNAVLAAKNEILTGERVVLDLPIGVPAHPICGRSTFQHTILRTGPGSADDEVHFNTQQGSQWDGLGHQAIKVSEEKYLCYNGINIDDITGGAMNKELGIQVWAEVGIVGRGVLLDYAAYAKRHSLQYSPLSTYGISVSDLKAVAAEQGVEFKRGDVLFLRTGYQEDMKDRPESEQKKIADELVAFAGFEQGEEMLRFLWDTHFAAAACDNPCFERHPPVGPMLHQPLIAGFGFSLGELFALDELAYKCAELGRYSFFLTSAPLHVPGGMASPPNAIAIF